EQQHANTTLELQRKAGQAAREQVAAASQGSELSEKNKRELAESLKVETEAEQEKTQAIEQGTAKIAELVAQQKALVSYDLTDLEKLKEQAAVTQRSIEYTEQHLSLLRQEADLSQAK